MVLMNKDLNVICGSHPNVGFNNGNIMLQTITMHANHYSEYSLVNKLDRYTTLMSILLYPEKARPASFSFIITHSNVCISE